MNNDKIDARITDLKKQVVDDLMSDLGDQSVSQPIQSAGASEEAAAEAAYPYVSSPHGSVIQRWQDNRAAFSKGYRAALAAPAAPTVQSDLSVVYQWLVGASRCGLVNIEPSARVLMDYYEGAEPDATPALPAIPQAPSLTDAQFLQPDDLATLKRFFECCDDPESGGHDVSKEAMARLRELGVVAYKNFGRHEITSFGDLVLCHTSGTDFKFPLKTYAEYCEESKARAAYSDGGDHD